MGPGSRPGRRRSLLLHHHPERSFAISRRIVPEVCQKLPALIKRAQGRPGARCTRGLVCDVHKTRCTRAYRAAENTRPSLRNGFTAYNAISLVNGLPCHHRPSEALASSELDASNGAPGPRVFAVRFSHVRLRDISVHRNPPNVRDDGRRPLSGTGWANICPLFGLLEKRNIFYFGA